MGRSVADPRRLLRVVGGLLRASITVSMQYRLDFVVEALSGLLRTAMALGPIGLLFVHRDAVLGWDAVDVATVMGLYLVLHALLAAIVEPNLGAIVEAIRKGTLDFVLLKPADAQLLTAVQQIRLPPLIDLPVGLGLVGWALIQRPPSSPLDVAVAAALALSGIAAIYGLWLLAVCTSFFFVRVDNLRYLLWSAVDAGRWPLPVFARWVQWALIVAVPVGVVTSFPAMALRGAWDAGLLALGLGVGAAFLVGSRLVWRASLARYTSASS
jgi:ABC-2 type transport system permease protein